MNLNNSNASLANETNEAQYYYYIYASLDQMLDLYTPWFGEYFWVFVYFPTSLLGFLLNILSFIIFFKKEFNIKLYTYFRHLSVAGLIFCGVSIPYPFSISKRFGFVSNYAFTAWQTYFYIPIGSTAHYYATVMDILILIDRLSTFVPKLKSIYSKVGSNKICIISFIIILIIIFPYFFVFDPILTIFPYYGSNNTVEIFSVYYTLPTTFATSTIGQIITFIIYSLRDAFVLLINIVLNTASTILLKRHLRKRAKMLKRGNTEQQIEEKKDNNNSKETKKDEKKKREGNVDRKASIMVIVLCTVSAISNTLYMSSIINFYFNYGSAANIFGQIGEYSLVTKYFLNFFVFYNFNTNFKNGLKKMIGIKT
jgi:hypothetical protein